MIPYNGRWSDITNKSKMMGISIFDATKTRHHHFPINPDEKRWYNAGDGIKRLTK